MTQSNEQVVQTARLQQEVMERLGLKQENIVFNYNEQDHLVHLEVITINPKHNQSFLFRKEDGISRMDALKKLIDYLDTTFQSENSYTIQWVKVGDSELHTSYFRAKNMQEVLDKFSYGRDINKYNIFSISLNPIS